MKTIILNETLIIMLANLDELISLNNSTTGVFSSSQFLGILKEDFKKDNLSYEKLKTSLDKIRNLKKDYLAYESMNRITREIYVKTSNIQAQIELLLFEIHNEVY